MATARYIAMLVLLMPSVAIASPARELEVGGVVGAASTSTSTTGPCPILFPGTEPADDCMSTPGHRGHGAVLGAQLRARVLVPLQVEAGLVYAQKGYNAGSEVLLHYLEAPLLVRFEPFAGATPARAFVYAGIAPAVLVACHAAGQLFVNDAPPHAEMYSGACSSLPPYADPTPRRVDLSGIVGLGLGWQFGFGAVEIQARLVRGLIDTDGPEVLGKTVNEGRYVLVGFDRKL